MKLRFNFKNWCNEYKGVFEFIALILLIIEIFRFNSISLNLRSTFFQKFGTVLTYNIKFPVYALIILFILTGIFLTRYRKKYSTNRKKYSSNNYFDFLVGTWKNDWGKGTEVCEITSDGKYYVNKEHWFNIDNLKVDASTGSINFLKTAVKPDDNRKLFTELRIVNNSRLEGKEDGKKISYTKIN